MAFDASDAGEPVTTINVTPLVDVVLVLLVVLMVAASGAVSEALPLDLPTAASGQAETTVLRVGIRADGALSLDGKVATLADVRAAAKALQAREPTARAALAAEGAARHEQVVAVLDALRASGVNRLAIQVTPAKP